ncbi:hypothetical protein [Polaromonas sp.]|uniref:hypothetical protein n=1 Tax=Polaromonas sp. TaxID=1869339 RepID=UPI0035634027
MTSKICPTAKRPRWNWPMAAAAALLACPLSFSATAETDLACEQAIAAVEARTPDLPRGLMRAVGKVESGRRASDGQIRPWPYTINVDGKGHYFPSAQAAMAFLREPGTWLARSVDVGCMQINLRYHPLAFEARADGFDAHPNVQYAAQYLLQLRQQHGSWDAAVRHYHSSDPVRQARYLGLVNRWRGAAPAELQSAPLQPATALAPAALIRVSDVAPQVRPAAMDGTLGQARTAMVRGEHETAARLCAAVPADSPMHVEALFCLALAAERRGDARAAMRHYAAVLMRKPTDGAALTSVLRLAQQSPAAIADWDKGVRWSQPHDALPALLTLARTGAPKWEEQLARAELLATEPQDLQALLLIAMTWEQAGEFERARRSFSQLLDRIPKNRESLALAVQERINSLPDPAPAAAPALPASQVRR